MWLVHRDYPTTDYSDRNKDGSFKIVVDNHWTELVDWTSGLDWWTGLKVIFMLTNENSPVELHFKT